MSIDKMIGCRVWAIPEGFIPSVSHGPEPEMTSHEAACILNTSEKEAHVELTVYFSDRDPAGPYELTISPRRTFHLRLNDLSKPEPIPRDTEYSTVIASDIPIVVQYTRLDSRQAANALLSTIAYPVSEPAMAGPAV